MRILSAVAALFFMSAPLLAADLPRQSYKDGPEAYAAPGISMGGIMNFFVSIPTYAGNFIGGTVETTGTVVGGVARGTGNVVTGVTKVVVGVPVSLMGSVVKPNQWGYEEDRRRRKYRSGFDFGPVNSPK